ncbi:hypothetical protein ANO14919_001940 [Xylariales sp. No.14919]|nr:hypothetical protein ANO14919_001940 [Xylariales sp. No.14919]
MLYVAVATMKLVMAGVEDAAVLGYLLGRVTDKSQIPKATGMYERLKLTRTTRMLDETQKHDTSDGTEVDWSYDAYKEAEDLLSITGSVNPPPGAQHGQPCGFVLPVEETRRLCGELVEMVKTKTLRDAFWPTLKELCLSKQTLPFCYEEMFPRMSHAIPSHMAFTLALRVFLNALSRFRDRLSEILFEPETFRGSRRLPAAHAGF